jgi:hypothetical protein
MSPGYPDTVPGFAERLSEVGAVRLQRTLGFKMIPGPKLREELHAKGAKRFPTRWFDANATAAHAAARLGIDSADEKIRCLLALVSLHFLVTFFDPKSIHCVKQKLNEQRRKRNPHT